MSDDALLRMAIAMERFSDVAEKFFDKLYPAEVKKREAVISKPDDEQREQLSDRGSPEWFNETEAATPQGKSRFFERFSQAGDTEVAAEKAGGAAKDGRKPRRTRVIPKHHRTDAGRTQ